MFYRTVMSILTVVIYMLYSFKALDMQFTAITLLYVLTLSSLLKD